MPDLPFYPAVVTVTVAVAVAASHFAGVPFVAAVVLVAAGVVTAGFVSYRVPEASASSGGRLAPWVQRAVARAFRLGIGTAAIAIAVVSVLRWQGVVAA